MIFFLFSFPCFLFLSSLFLLFLSFLFFPFLFPFSLSFLPFPLSSLLFFVSFFPMELRLSCVCVAIGTTCNIYVVGGLSWVANGIIGFSRREYISVAPVACQVILEPGVGQFREFEPRRVHTRINSSGLFLVHILTCGKRESVG